MVDDDRWIAATVRRALTYEGWTIDGAGDGWGEVDEEWLKAAVGD